MGASTIKWLISGHCESLLLNWDEAEKQITVINRNTTCNVQEIHVNQNCQNDKDFNEQHVKIPQR